MGKQKIAVLGGGIGALSAAYALTLVPGARERYEIDVYSVGWRIGGKGASGRNAKRGERIEEHGLHVWLGFYQNAFALIQHCYAELEGVALREGSPRPRKWTEAFSRHDELAVTDRSARGYRPIRMQFPTSQQAPGGRHPRLLPSLRHYTEVAGALLGNLRRQHRKGNTLKSLKRLARAVKTEVTVKRRFFFGAHNAPADTTFEQDDSQRDVFQLVDLFASLALGLIVELGIRRKRLDDLDDEEFLEWLHKWGADKGTLDSALLRGIYDMGFAFDEGDTSRPNFAAGAFIRATLRILFTYEGAIFWKMEGGMGDIVFTPLYRVLRARGVRFHFFHRVDRIEPTVDGRAVGRVEMTVQAKARSGTYAPFRDVHGEPCWPSEPDFEQLEHGEVLRDHVGWFEDPRAPAPPVALEHKTLEFGRDFDRVVLGIPVGALRTLAAPLGQACPRFGRMLMHLQTVQTQAAQLWLRPSLNHLGYRQPSPVLASFVDPLNTWADMSHLIEHEDWSPDEVGSIAYYCGPRQAPDDLPAESREVELAGVKQAVEEVLAAKVDGLWPGARCDCGGFNERLLVGDDSGDGRVDQQYLRVNSAPSERYTLTAAGTTRFRLAPDDSGFTNLFLCGDWTRNDFNTGCIEATVMSGLKAARALAAYPFHIVGAQKDHLTSQTSLWAQEHKT